VQSSDVAAYLDRIGYTGELTPSEPVLRELHRAHLLAVPFENLDISRGVPIQLDYPALFGKIVTRRRGGFCYELNGLFAELLRALGFSVKLLSASVADGAGNGAGEADASEADSVGAPPPMIVLPSASTALIASVTEPVPYIV